MKERAATFVILKAKAVELVRVTAVAWLFIRGGFQEAVSFS